MEKISILIVDDHSILREGLVLVISDQSNMAVVGEAGDGAEAIEKCRSTCPDIIIMDLDMPKINGIEATGEIVTSCPDTKVIILSMYPDHEFVKASLEAGAKGFLVKESAAGELVQAINVVNRGKAYFSPAISDTIVENLYSQSKMKANESNKLTARETEILKLVAEGKTSKQISKELYISPATTAKHRENIMNKLDIHDVAGLTQYAIQKGLIIINKPKNL